LAVLGVLSGEASLLLVSLPAQPGDLVNAICSGGSDILVRYLLRSAEDVNGTDRAGRTALHLAVEQKRADLCKLLLEHERFTRADATAGMGSGIAYEQAREAAFAQHNFDLEGIDGSIGTALQVAVESACPEICKLLLESSRFTAVNERCWFLFGRCYETETYIRSEATVLHLAASRGHTQICLMLLESPRFTAVNAKDSLGNTALHLGVSMLHEDTCNALAAHPAVDADVKDNVGFTAFEVGIVCTRDHEAHRMHVLSDFGCDKFECRHWAIGVCKVLLACDRCQPPHEKQAELNKAFGDLSRDEAFSDRRRASKEDEDDGCGSAAQGSSASMKEMQAEQRERSRRQDAKRRDAQEQAVERRLRAERRHGQRSSQRQGHGQKNAGGCRQKKANAGRALMAMAFSFSDSLDA